MSLGKITINNPKNPFEIATKTYTFLLSQDSQLADHWLSAYRACRTKEDVLNLSKDYVSFAINHDYKRYYAYDDPNNC